MLRKRGLFIVFEGIDRCGKSTQARCLVEYLKSIGLEVIFISFPDRDSATGQVINEYLKCETIIRKECLHLMFSANRWEKMDIIEDYLQSGVTVVCDRYTYSGISYSVGAEGLDFTWCLSTDKGLIQPDIVYQLIANPQKCLSRCGFGTEVYEKIDILTSVSKIYERFHQAEYWVLIGDTSSDINIPKSGVGDDSADKLELQIAGVFKKIQDHINLYLQENKYFVSNIFKLEISHLGNSPPW